MGCDIHIIAEVKENGQWRANNEKVFPNPWYKTKEEKPDRNEWELDEFLRDPDDDRNYDWFAVLADVRNGRGFAGIKTGDGFSVISPPKGVPEDASPEWSRVVEHWEGDMHSRSYLTVDEFDSFDWNQVTTKQGCITLDEYKELKDTAEEPELYCGMIYGPSIKVLSEAEADDQLKKIEAGYIEDGDEEIRFYVKHHWPIIYTEYFSHKFESTINPLRKLKEKYEDARICFGFDN